MKESKGAQLIVETKNLIKNWKQNLNEWNPQYTQYTDELNAESPNTKYNGNFTLNVDEYGIEAKLIDGNNQEFIYNVKSELVYNYPHDTKSVEYVNQVFKDAKSSPDILKDEKVLSNFNSFINMFVEDRYPDFDIPEEQEFGIDGRPDAYNENMEIEDRFKHRYEGEHRLNRIVDPNSPKITDAELDEVEPKILPYLNDHERYEYSGNWFLTKIIQNRDDAVNNMCCGIHTQEFALKDGTILYFAFDYGH